MSTTFDETYTEFIESIDPYSIAGCYFQDEEEWEWCIDDEENPGYYLCGDLAEEEIIVPYEEIPDELTCEACLAEERRREFWENIIG